MPMKLVRRDELQRDGLADRVARILGGQLPARLSEVIDDGRFRQRQRRRDLRSRLAGGGPAETFALARGQYRHHRLGLRARGRSLRAFLDDAADSAVGVAGDQLALGERCDDLALGLDSAYTFDEADRGPVPDRS